MLPYGSHFDANNLRLGCHRVRQRAALCMMNVQRSLICASHSAFWPEGLEVQKNVWPAFHFVHDQSVLHNSAWGGFVAWPMRHWGWLGKSHGSRSCKWACCFFPLYCWCWVMVLVCNAERGRWRCRWDPFFCTGQLSAAMDKANAVASEEQGDYLLWMAWRKLSKCYSINQPDKLTADVHGKSGKLTRAWQTVQFVLS